MYTSCVSISKEFVPYLPAKFGEILCLYGDDDFSPSVCLPGAMRLWLAEVIHFNPKAKDEQFVGNDSLVSCLFISKGLSYSRSSNNIDNEHVVFVEDLEYCRSYFGPGHIVDKVQGVQYLKQHNFGQEKMVLSVSNEECRRLQAVAAVSTFFVSLCAL